MLNSVFWRYKIVPREEKAISTKMWGLKSKELVAQCDEME